MTIELERMQSERQSRRRVERGGRMRVLVIPFYVSDREDSYVPL